MITIDHTIRLILQDPAASTWIKQALQSAVNRDPADALNDAEILAKILKHKVRNIQTVAQLKAQKEARHVA